MGRNPWLAICGLPILLLLTSCGTPSINVVFAVPSTGLELAAPSLSIDVMVLGKGGDEGDLSEKLAKPEERGRWFNYRDPALKNLRERLRRQGRLVSVEAKQGQREMAPISLTPGEQPDGALVIVVGDIPGDPEDTQVKALGSTALLDGKEFVVRVVRNRLQVAPQKNE